MVESEGHPPGSDFEFSICSLAGWSFPIRSGGWAGPEAVFCSMGRVRGLYSIGQSSLILEW